jgi:WD40 repeat protein
VDCNGPIQYSIIANCIAAPTKAHSMLAILTRNSLPPSRQLANTVLDFLSGAVIHKFDAEHGIRCCAFPGQVGKEHLLLECAGGSDGEIKLRNLNEGITKQAFGDMANDLAFSPDGQFMSISMANSTKIRDAYSGEEIKIQQHNGSTMEVTAFSPDSRLFVHAGWKCMSDSTNGDKCKVEVCAIETGKVVDTFMAQNGVIGLCFLGGNRVAAASLPNELLVYDLETQQGKVYSHKCNVQKRAWTFCPEAGRAAVGGKDKEVTIVNLNTCEKEGKALTFGAHVKCTCYSKSGRFLACGGKTKKVILYVFDDEDSIPDATVEIGTDGVTEMLAISPCEQYLAHADDTNKTRVFGMKNMNGDGGVQLLHMFQLNGPIMSFTFNHSGQCLGCAIGGNAPSVRVWEIGEDADPLPYEFEIEWYFRHYVAKKPHLVYRKDHNSAAKGNTIVHRLAQEGSEELLKTHLATLSGLLPVENDEGHTPVDHTLKRTNRAKTTMLLDLYTRNMTPRLAALPLFPRILGANMGTETKLSREDVLELFADKKYDFSNVVCRDGIFYATDKDPYYNTCVHKFPELCVMLLERSTMSVTSATVQEGTHRLFLQHFLKKPSDHFCPTEPLWSKHDNQAAGGQEVEIEAFVTGFHDFITSDGSFKAIVRSQNEALFETTAMKRGIEYKWETYGLFVQNVTTVLYSLMIMFFLMSLVFVTGEEESSKRKHSFFMGCSSVASLFIVWKEMRDFNGDRRYWKRWVNVMDNMVIVLVWVLTLWSVLALDADLSNAEKTTRRLCIAVTVFLALLNFLMYLSAYKFIGAVLFIFQEVVVDFMPILTVMLLFLGAYVIALRMVLAGGSDSDEYGGETSPFDAGSGDLQWNDFSRMVNIAFNFGFMGSLDQVYLEAYNPDIYQERVILNMFSQLLFYVYAVVSNIILLNLLIAVMSDSYDRVKEVESYQRRLLRANALLDMERTWGNMLKKRSQWCFPNCLHVLARKGGLHEDDIDGLAWAGRIKEIKNEMKRDFIGFRAEISGIMKGDLSLGLNAVTDKLQGLDNKIESVGRMKQGILAIDRRLREMEGKLDAIEPTSAKKQTIT